MELKKLEEFKRKVMIKDDMETLDLLATLHNLFGCIERQEWVRLPNKVTAAEMSYNRLIEKLNRSELSSS